MVDLDTFTVLTDSLVRVYIFVFLGMAIWLISKYFPMKEYENQKITLADYFFILTALMIAGVYELLITPAIQHIFKNFSDVHFFLSQTVEKWGLWFQIPAYLLVTDFLGYCFHRLMHSRLLWRLHAFHHSIQSLNWVSGVRGSPLHIFLVILPSMLTSSIFLLTDQTVAFYVVVFFDICSQHLTHSNVYLPYASKLERFLVTPRMHFIHHHIDERYGNSNFGFYFSIWDHLFGTYVNADDVNQKGQLGLTNNYSTSSLFWGMQLKEKASNK